MLPHGSKKSCMFPIPKYRPSVLKTNPEGPNRYIRHNMWDVQFVHAEKGSFALSIPYVVFTPDSSV